MSQEFQISQAFPSDAPSLHQLRLKLDQQSDFMLVEPGERKYDEDEQRNRILSLNAIANSAIFIARKHDETIGFLQAKGGLFNRNRQTIDIVVGVSADYSGKGVGTQLFKAVEEWARKKGLHRLELTVMAHNRAAIRLYTKCGFSIEGTKHDSLCVNGQYVDELMMSKILQ